METLPKDLLIYLSHFLDYQDIINLSLINNNFKKIYESNNVWRILTVRDCYPHIYENYITPEKYFLNNRYDNFSRKTYEIMKYHYLKFRHGIKIKIISKSVNGNMITVHKYKQILNGTFDFLLCDYSSTYMIYKYLEEYGGYISSSLSKHFDGNCNINSLLNEALGDHHEEGPEFSDSFITEIRNSTVKVLPPNSILFFDGGVISTWNTINININIMTKSDDLIPNLTSGLTLSKNINNAILNVP